ncbi:MAG TPA: hypothetical protein VHX38_27755 [Pseudonocardiaceae bacterium]|jgi:hypothetical protein|nr:hypothetical protein [Pseudonocardiaceae bacterium]
MRHSKVVLGAAGAIIMGSALVACGQGTSTSGSASQSSGTSAASSTQVVTAAYVKTTDAGSAKILLVGQINTTVNGKQESIPITATGTIDFATKATDLTETVAGQSNVNTETRYLNGMLYQRLPAGATQLSGGKPWISLNIAQFAQQQGGSGLRQLLSGAPSDPSDVLAYLRSVDGNVRSTGQATVDGVSTTHYTATIDLSKVASADPNAAAATKQLEQKLGTSTMPVQLWIDQQGRVRQISVDETIAHPLGGSTSASGTTSGANSPSVGPVHTTITVTLSDYGTPVHIVAPAADQTADLTGALAGGK